MTRVADILVTKGPHVYSVSPETRVVEAVALMVEHNLGSLLVFDGESIAGIFTERDHLRRVTLADRDPKTTLIREVMTPRLVYVDPDTTVSECMAVMTGERIRHLPVVEANRVVGMISIGDLVKHVSREQEVEIRYLTEYITGQRLE